MLNPMQFNPHRELLDRYEGLARTVAFRYGPQSQGIIFVLYDELIALRNVLVEHPESVVVRAWVRAVAGWLAARYRENSFTTDGNSSSTVVRTDPVVVEYSRDVFEERYRPAVPVVAGDTVEITGRHLPGLEPGRPYMFVIDDRGRFLVWSRSFTFEELVFGRNRATVAGIPVAHPMLVPERLRARAAGEIVFIGAPRVEAVIVNNKSGHFRFPPSCRSAIHHACRTAFDLPDEAIDILLFGDGNDRARAGDGAVELAGDRR